MKNTYNLYSLIEKGFEILLSIIIEHLQNNIDKSPQKINKSVMYFIIKI